MCGKLAMPAVISPSATLASASTLTSAAMANAAHALGSASGSLSRPRSPAKSSPPAPVSSSSTSAANGDDLGSSDEVKVFNNEDDDEREVSESGHLQNDLQEEKSSLITESETVRETTIQILDPFSFPVLHFFS